MTGRITDGCCPEFARAVRSILSPETPKQYISTACFSQVEDRDRGILAADEVFNRGWRAWEFGLRAQR